MWGLNKAFHNVFSLSLSLTETLGVCTRYDCIKDSTISIHFDLILLSCFILMNFISRTGMDARGGKSDLSSTLKPEHDPIDYIIIWLFDVLCSFQFCNFAITHDGRWSMHCEKLADSLQVVTFFIMLQILTLSIIASFLSWQYKNFHIWFNTYNC